MNRPEGNVRPRRNAVTVVALAAGLALAGCASAPSAVKPWTWFGGGDAAATPGPGADQPYPNLADVPDRPKAPSAEEQRRMAQGLLADREAARYTDEAIRRQEPPMVASAPPRPESRIEPAAGPPPLARQPVAVEPVPPPATPAPAPAPAEATLPLFPERPAAPAAESAAPAPPPPPEPPRDEAARPAPPAPIEAPPPATAGATPRPERAAAEPPPLQPAEAPPSPPPPPRSAQVPAAPAQPVARPAAPVQSAPVARQPSQSVRAAPTPPAAVEPASGGPRRATPAPSELVWGPPPPDIDIVRRGAEPVEELAAGLAALDEPYATGTAIRVATVRFNSGSARLGANDERALLRVAALYRSRGGRVTIVGHASGEGRTASVRHEMANLTVSMDRAAAVARALERHGVPADRIEITALSDNDPVARETGPAGEAANRRADVFLRR
jgi:outer membrane protein OmpA-like peptidoglycan-associated protein